MVLKKFCIMPPKNKDKKFYGHGQKDPAQKSRISCLETNVITQSKRETLVRSKNNSTNRSTITSSEKKNSSDIPDASPQQKIATRVSCVSSNDNNTFPSSMSSQSTTFSSSSTSSTLLSKRPFNNELKWWENLPPPKKLKPPKVKPSGKKNIDWSQIPQHIEEYIDGKCPDGTWIDCRICKKYAPDCAAVYRTNSMTPFSYGNFGKHLTKKPHRINQQKHQHYLRQRRNNDGTPMEKTKKQTMLYSFISPIKSTQQPSTCHKTPVIFEKQSTSEETSNLPADKCRGIFSSKQLCTNKVQSGLQFYQNFFAHDSKLLWYVDCIGNTSFKSIFQQIVKEIVSLNG